MIFLILTRSGYESLVAELKPAPSAYWLNAGILSPQEVTELRQDGYNITEFTQPIITNNSLALEVAINSIQQHHDGQKVWVEYVNL